MEKKGVEQNYVNHDLSESWIIRENMAPASALVLSCSNARSTYVTASHVTPGIPEDAICRLHLFGTLAVRGFALPATLLWDGPERSRGLGSCGPEDGQRNKVQDPAVCHLPLATELQQSNNHIPIKGEALYCCPSNLFSDVLRLVTFTLCFNNLHSKHCEDKSALLWQSVDACFQIKPVMDDICT
ncbi:hypothetical protein E2C01_001510 [Portunus trituberculatus]|uniref:Uncharacterized protein n=1 Tax=Portunus trituberculatus TaxID=210409 RepID=A0A5B7CMN3_PORTR|nr:hypothetical protein [Portunus trituberculatus]